MDKLCTWVHAISSHFERITLDLLDRIQALDFKQYSSCFLLYQSLDSSWYKRKQCVSQRSDDAVLKMITTFSSHGFFVGSVFSHGFDWFVAHDNSRKVWSPDWCKVLVRILSFYWEFVSSICSCSWTAEHVSPTEHIQCFFPLVRTCKITQFYAEHKKAPQNEHWTELDRGVFSVS
jgi:hypothetical protein